MNSSIFSFISPLEGFCFCALSMSCVSSSSCRRASDLPSAENMRRSVEEVSERPFWRSPRLAQGLKSLKRTRSLFK